MNSILEHIVFPLAVIFDYIGATIISIAAFVALYQYIKREFFSKEKEKRLLRELTRMEFGQKIILGLEFFLAGDIIRTVSAPTWDSIGKLGALVAIRTVLTYFLSRELKK